MSGPPAGPAGSPFFLHPMALLLAAYFLAQVHRGFCQQGQGEEYGQQAAHGHHEGQAAEGGGQRINSRWPAASPPLFQSGKWWMKRGEVGRAGREREREREKERKRKILLSTRPGHPG